MPAIVWVVGSLVVVVGALLAGDWFAAGRVRKARRMLARAQDGSATDANVHYANLEQTVREMQHWHPNPGPSSATAGHGADCGRAPRGRAPAATATARSEFAPANPLCAKAIIGPRSA